ncbi:MAG: glycosyl hydrolase [Gemmatimonadetes bacterium]|nr:MAG: glycosyl hydrolase [Gemmatimonadota bacterium]
MGTTGGGVFKSTDGGDTWTPASDKYFGGTIGAIGVSESNPDVVYVGTGEYPIRGNVAAGDGVWKTTDGGKTWTNVGLAETQQISRVRVHPTNPDIVWVGAQGHAYGPNPERGVYKTTDGGKTWNKVLFRNDSTGISDVVLDPSNPNVLYAAFWQAQRYPWKLVSGGAGGGLFKSVDGGERWTEITHNPGLPTGVLGNIGLAVSAAKPTRLWALIEAEQGGLYRSDDSGATWRHINAERKLRQYALNVLAYKSTDGGATFKWLVDPHGDNHDMWIASNDPQRMIEGNDGGANVSFNGGRTWSDQDYATAQFYHVTTTNHFPYRVCGAQQDNSGVCGPSRWPGGIDRGQWYDVAGEAGHVQARSDNPDITYGGDNSGFLIRVDHKTGFGQIINPWPDSPDGHPAGEGKYRLQWTAPLLLSPHDPKVLYIGANVLFKSVNEGQSWTAISPDLTRHDPATLGVSGGPITLDQTTAEYYATIFALAESPRVKGLIWAGSDDGLVHITRDGGKTWQDVTPRDLGPYTRISGIEASHYAPGAAYLAANRYQLEDRAPYIYRTTDYGRTWKKIVTGIPATEFVRMVREDPVRRGLLFAGTEHGVWVSFDDGANWQSLRRNLPIVPVHDLTIKEGDLVAATHGRSFWILDDISPLRELAHATPREAAHLVKPRDAYRVDWSGGFGFPPNEAHPVGKNPPTGAMIYYWLKDKDQRVTLDILDAGGRVVRSFTSKADSITAADSVRADSVKKVRTDSLKQAGVTDSVKIDSIVSDTLKDADKPWPQRPPAPPRVANKAGLNMFVWNMKYPDAAAFWGMVGVTTDGPVALPGAYQVRLRVGGKAYAQRFALKVDPRSTVTPAALREQFTFLKQLRDTVNAATTAVLTIRNVRTQLEDRLAAAPPSDSARLGAQVRGLTDRLGAIERELYQVRNRSFQDPLNFPPMLIERISALGGVAASTDARPTAQTYAVYRLFAPQIQQQLLALQQALKRDLPAVNTAFKTASVATVVAKAAEVRPPAPERAQ